MPSKIELRRLTLEPENAEIGFILADRDTLLYRNDEQSYQGRFHSEAASQVRALGGVFRHLWEHAVAEPRLRRLAL